MLGVAQPFGLATPPFIIEPFFTGLFQMQRAGEKRAGPTGSAAIMRCHSHVAKDITNL